MKHLPRQGSFFNKNSSKATQPPPTRTITVDRRIRTNRNFWLSPNCNREKKNIEIKIVKTRTIKYMYNVYNNRKKMKINFQIYLYTLYFPSPTWNTRNFCRQVQSITNRFTSSWILSVSLYVLRSSQSGLKAAMNSFQSINPSPCWSNKSATAPISNLEVSNSIKKLNCINSTC